MVSCEVHTVGICHDFGQDSVNFLMILARLSVTTLAKTLLRLCRDSAKTLSILRQLC